MRLYLQFFGGRGASSASSGKDSLAGIRKGTEATPEEATERVNTHHYDTDRTYRENCQRCVWAYELQRRGYDVEALPTYQGDNLPKNGNWMGVISGSVTKEYVGTHWGQTNSIKTEVANTTEVMRGWGEGSRGIMRVAWQGGGGHVFNVEYRNGKVMAYDAQTGKVYDTLNAALKGTRRQYTQIIRSDNVTFNEGHLHKYVKERGK